MQSILAQLLAHSQALRKRWLVMITVIRAQCVDMQGAGTAQTKALRAVSVCRSACVWHMWSEDVSCGNTGQKGSGAGSCHLPPQPPLPSGASETVSLCRVRHGPGCF